MIYVGIDPGKTGAISVIWECSKPTVFPMPILPGKKGKSRNEYDILGIRNHIDSWDMPMFIMVEKSQPMPATMPGGSLANYNRGVSMGWTWLLTGMGISHELVAPRTWQKVMLAGTPGSDTKQKSIIAAQRLFPGVRLTRTERSRKLDDGISDALLIAEYGRRVHGGK